MQKICVIALSLTLIAVGEGGSQGKWSRPIRDTPSTYTRERRQFLFGEWIPLSKPCPTCRPLVDQQDVNQWTDNTDLKPPRPPTVTRQIHAEGNFFPQDDSAVLSVPPPPPGLAHHPITSPGSTFQNIPFQSIGHHFNNPLPAFPQTQPISFIQQPFVTNQNLLVNTNQQTFGQSQGQLGQHKFTENVVLGGSGGSVFSNTPAPFTKQQTVIHHNPPNQAFSLHQGFSQQKTFPSSQGFTLQQGFSQQKTFPGQQSQQQSFSQQQQGFTQQKTFPGQQSQQQGVVQQQQGFSQQKGFNQQQVFSQQKGFPQQQAFGQQSQQAFSKQQILTQQQPVIKQQQNSFEGSILTPPPVANVTAQNVGIPGLNKEEIQLLYVPVETLRQRGNAQQQFLLQQQQQQRQQQQQQQQRHQIQQNIELQGRPNSVTNGGEINFRPTEATETVGQHSGGLFVTESSGNQGPALSTVQISSAHPFSTAATPSTVFFESLTSKPTPHSFVSATPITSTSSPFITPSPFTQTFSSVTPETTLAQLSTVQNSIQYSQPELQFVTTPKNLLSEEGLREEIITGKPQFDNFEDQQFGHEFAFQRQPQSQIQGNSQQTIFFGRTQEDVQSNQNKFTQEQTKTSLPAPTQTQQINDQDEFALHRQQGKISLAKQKQKKQKEENDLNEQYIKQQEIEAQRVIDERNQKQIEEQRFLQKQLKQKELKEQREKEQQQERYHLQEQRRKELNQERYQQKERRKEQDQERYQQQELQKELNQQKYLQSQRQKESEKEHELQQQRQTELDEQRRIQGLRQIEEKRRLQQKQRVQDEKNSLLWQHQEQQQKQQNEQQQQSDSQQQRQKQNNYRKKPEFYQQNPQQQQQSLQQVQQHIAQQPTEQPIRNSFSEFENANFISQVEKETETEAPQLVPHQPPLSVFYKGLGKTQPRIGEVLKELRSSRTITVLDQYFERMPKVFVGPAGLVAPAGYEKFELPYLSNIETKLFGKNVEKLPFFVAPLNFVPPAGYSKIPFPSPHVGSVVISTDSTPVTTIRPPRTESTPADEKERVPSFLLVGPELPGLINSLESETTTIKSTTPALPQTTAQLRNRRPNTNYYRGRKPVSKARSTTTTTPAPTTKPEEPKSENSEGFLRKPFNSFLKRRRQQVKTTTETPTSPQTEASRTDSRQYQFKKHFGDVNAGTRQYGNQDQVIDRTSSQSQDEYSVRSGGQKFRQTSTSIFSKQRGQKVTEENGNNLQSFEDGPYPTGSAKTITQEVYTPNGVRSKLESKIDTSTVSGKFHYAQDSEANPTAGYLKSSQDKSGEFFQTTAASLTEKQYSPVPTSLKYFDQTEYPKTDSPVSAQSVYEKQPQTTEFIALDDTYTSAFAEISKHHHIPRPQEEYKAYDKQQQSSGGLAIELQAPLSESYSSEQISHELTDSADDVKPTNPVFYTSENSASLTSEDYSQSAEEHKFEDSADGETHETSGKSKTTQAVALNSQNYVTEEVPQEYEESTETTGSNTRIEVGRSKPEISTIQQTDYEVTTIENNGYNNEETSSNSGGQKFGTLSGVRVRSRIRGKPRGQGSYSGSQSTQTGKIKAETEYTGNIRQQYGGKEQDNQYNQQSVVTKYNLRGGKKPFRTTQDVTTTENDNKANAYTIKPHKRPIFASTVSTKRIRRPTTPLPAPEEASVPTLVTYQPDSEDSELEFPGSGVSNEVLYEHTSLPSIRQKFRKTYESRERQVNIPASTFRPKEQIYTSYVEEEDANTKDEESRIQVQDSSESYPQWNLHESNADASGITLTTVRTSTEIQTEAEEAKKSQENKKAFDPDLEKKGGRRRIRVRVHKRPHENFETAESQNLRTVANVLVPPTSTYKPIEEGSLQVSGKNSYSGQKSFGSRSREYFKKRLNITLPDPSAGIQQIGSVNLETSEQSTKTDEALTEINGSEIEGGKVFRPKFRGFVRKVIKHPIKGDEEKKSEQFAGTTDENAENKQTKIVHGGFNHTGRLNGVRHKTFVRYVKKNKVKPVVDEAQEEDNQQEKEIEVSQNAENQEQNEEHRDSATVFATHTTEQTEVQQTEGPSSVTEAQQTEAYATESLESNREEGHDLEETLSTDLDVSTEPVQVQTTEQYIFGKGATKLFPVSSLKQIKQTESKSSLKESGESQQSEISFVKPTEARGSYKSRFYQTLRPVYQRAPNTGILRIKETPISPTTEAQVQEQTEPTKRARVNKYKYNKVGFYGQSTTSTEDGTNVADGKKSSVEQQIKTKSLYNSDVRKYNRGKTREGGFGQFNKNRYTTSGKTGTSSTFEDTTSYEFPTTEYLGRTVQDFATVTEFFDTTNTNAQETDYTVVTTKQPTTFSDLENLGEDSLEEEVEGEKERSTSTGLSTTDRVETTVEDKTEVPTTLFSTSPSDDITTGATEVSVTDQSEGKTETAGQPDLYRFGKNSFSFDETENFTGTKNRAYVRNITAEIIENTSSFSAPGVEQRDEKFASHVVGSDSRETTTATDGESETYATTINPEIVEATTEDDATEIKTTSLPPVISIVTDVESNKSKTSKLVKTSTTTKVSHETEICYRGRCIRTKSENPEEDLKMLVDEEKMKDLQKIKS